MANKFAGEPDISSIQPDRLIKYRISEDRFSAEVLLPGFAYTDFDQKIGGKVNLWSLAKVFESIRYTVLSRGFGHFDRLKDKQHSMFMASTQYHITEEGNNIFAYKDWGTNLPMYVTLRINYAGKSAFSFIIHITNNDTCDLLYSSTLTFVYVEYKTRKPVPFPDWYNQLKEQQKFDPPQPRLPTPVIPPGAFTFQVKSSFADIDHNGHVNQSIYVKWCTDAGTEAALKGNYSRFADNIGKYPLDIFEVKYIGEGFVGETFVVYTWQDSTVPLVLYFAITKMEKITLVARFKYKSAEFGARL